MRTDDVVTLAVVNQLLCDANRREGGEGDKERAPLVLIIAEMSVDVYMGLFT